MIFCCFGHVVVVWFVQVCLLFDSVRLILFVAAASLFMDMFGELFKCINFLVDESCVP